MDSLEQFADLYGPPARRSEYRVDERVAWREGCTQKHGVVIYVVAPTPERPLVYVVSPDVEVFPVELMAHEVSSV